MDLVIVGYPERLVDDHRALVEAATTAGFRAEVVAPSRLALVVDDAGERVLKDGQEYRPHVALPRGVNRPWAMVRQLLEVWQQQGCVVVPAISASELCADKVATTRALGRAGVPVLPTVGVVPGDGVDLNGLVSPHTVVVKPARASKARGVEAFDTVSDAQESLRRGRSLVADLVDHQLVQPQASSAGCDFRVVVADGEVVALTRRVAPPDEFITNRPGAEVTDVLPPFHGHGDVVDVAVAAAGALDLAFAGVDVIRHHDQAVVLEVNAWPGLAAAVRHDRLAKSLVEVARRHLDRL